MAEIKGSNNNVNDNNITNPKDEVKIDQTKQSRTQKGPVKDKNAKAPSSSVHANLVNRSKTGRDKEASSAVSNGTLALTSRPRQSIKSRSFNDRPIQESKHPSKSGAASSEVSTEKTKPKLLKKGPLDNVQEEEEESSLSTNTDDAKPRRVGTLPNYGFNFRCGERAERRKEFYNKLEEKIQAKEVEKSNLQAKTKETQEAEIKMLRKSLTFKATPMPSFYQEPPPPKVELKKIPTTRAKSPKLGRKKSSTNSEVDGNSSSSSQLPRLSLDEKVLQINPTKGTTSVHQKKLLHRRSLPPRLASEKNTSSNSTTAPTSSKAIKDEKSSLSSTTKKDANLSNATGEEKTEMTAANEVKTEMIAANEEKTEMIAVNEEKSTLSNDTSDAMPLNAVPSDKPSEAEESHLNGDIAIEENTHLTFPQEPIAAEH
ncbi:hypothetical protein VNO77_30387 [Canavalia gladiata]|uniref:TPX2 C-terminal domain-containing protein n=1 Tax=Canavalia gladiata TaxID=3824 RepID=A0AAN9Q770_CANGL